MIGLKLIKEVSTDNNKTIKFYQADTGEVVKILFDENGEISTLENEEIPLERIIEFKDDGINNTHDHIFKFIAENYIQAFLNVFGLGHIKFKRFLNVEIIDYTLHQSYCNIVIEDEDGRIYIIEFQSTGPGIEDKIRFGDYQTSLHRRENGKEVIVIVITINNDTENDEQYKYGKEYCYRLNKRTTTKFDTEKVINELIYKTKNDSMDDEAFIKLAILPYMESNIERRKLLLKIAIALKKRANLSKKRRSEITPIQGALVGHYFNDKELTNIMTRGMRMNEIEQCALRSVDRALNYMEKENGNLEKELKAKDEEINKIRKLFKDFSESGDKKAMNTLKSILL